MKEFRFFTPTINGIPVAFVHHVMSVLPTAGVDRKPFQPPASVPQDHYARRNVHHPPTPYLVSGTDDAAVDDREFPIGRIENRTEHGVGRRVRHR